MDKMSIEKIRDMLCLEVDEIGEKGVMSAGDLETLHKLTDTIKNLDKIEMLEGDEYSQHGDYPMAGEWEARGGYGRTGYGRADEMMYERGNSYAGRHRDSMGRYSRAEAQDEIMKKLREMAADTTLPQKYRDTARKAMGEMK